MQAVLLFFVDLCLLRRGPQDLPASQALFGLTLAADLLAGVMLAVAGGLSPGQGLLHGALDAVLILVVLRIALGLTGHPGRLIQTGSALFGSAALIGLAALGPVALLPTGEGAEASGLGVLLVLGLIAWNVLVTGHILRHAFGLGLGLGAGIALAYDLVAYALLGAVFGGA